MAEKVTLKLSAAAAAYVGKEAARDTKIEAARGNIVLSGRDLAHLLYFLAHDPDQEVKDEAIRSLRALPETQVLAIADDPLVHPRILEMFAHLHFQKSEIVEKLLSNPSLEERAAIFLKDKQAELAANEESEELEQADEEVERPETMDEDSTPLDGDEKVDEESEEYLSKYKLSMKMEIDEKIKVALKGDKEWRTLLVRDSNRLVCTSVLKNPRITEGEVLAIAQVSNQNEEIMRLICANKDWLKNYKIRKALVHNCKTPLQTALRLLNSMTDRDLANLVKSRDVSHVISTMARKYLFNRVYKNK
jgi:hypothetical protein